MERQNICDLHTRPFNDILPTTDHPLKPETLDQTYRKIG